MPWNPSTTTINRTIEQTDYLIAHFTDCIECFNEINNTLFDGPSFYFHDKCIRDFPTFEEKVEEGNRIKFLEFVYATLTSWGMHRLGKTKTRLVNFNELRHSVFTDNPAERLTIFNNINEWHITNIPINGDHENHLERVMFNFAIEDPLGRLDKIIYLITSLTVSQSNSHLVANSKLLHHFFPKLIVPIDRQYTLKFFGIDGGRLNTDTHHTGTLDVFNYLYPYIVKIANHKYGDIQALVIENENNHNSWHSSFTKVIDNAIIGAVQLQDGEEE